MSRLRLRLLLRLLDRLSGVLPLLLVLLVRWRGCCQVAAMMVVVLLKSALVEDRALYLWWQGLWMHEIDRLTRVRR